MCVCVCVCVSVCVCVLVCACQTVYSASPCTQPLTRAYTLTLTPSPFPTESLKRIETILSWYPKGYEKAAMIPLLDLAQRQNQNWLSLSAMHKVLVTYVLMNECMYVCVCVCACVCTCALVVVFTLSCQWAFVCVPIYPLTMHGTHSRHCDSLFA